MTKWLQELELAIQVSLLAQNLRGIQISTYVPAENAASIHDIERFINNRKFNTID